MRCIKLRFSILICARLETKLGLAHLYLHNGMGGPKYVTVVECSLLVSKLNFLDLNLPSLFGDHLLSFGPINRGVYLL